MKQKRWIDLGRGDEKSVEPDTDTAGTCRVLAHPSIPDLREVGGKLFMGYRVS
ncbi:MAG: hypothetical protein ACPHL6_02065 [Rubripirellula sp.]